MKSAMLFCVGMDVRSFYHMEHFLKLLKKWTGGELMRKSKKDILYKVKFFGRNIWKCALAPLKDVIYYCATGICKCNRCRGLARR